LTTGLGVPGLAPQGCPPGLQGGRKGGTSHLLIYKAEGLFIKKSVIKIIFLLFNFNKRE